MAITTTCAGCGKTLAVADEYAGRQARCPECGTIYTVPASAPAPIDLGPGNAGRTPGILSDTIGYPASDAPLDLGSSTYPAPLSPLPPPAPLAPLNDPYAEPEIKYWMRATNGAEYGPADRATLDRWFSEGRVGQHYQIRMGENGMWQPATMFQPGNRSAMPASPVTASAASNNPYASNSTNPFAAQSAMAAGVATQRQYPKTDQSGLVLAMGILAWLGFCPIFGIIGWVVGAQAISDIRAGQSDPSKLGLVQIGYYLSMVNVVLVIGCIGLIFLFAAIGAVVG